MTIKNVELLAATKKPLRVQAAGPPSDLVGPASLQKQQPGSQARSKILSGVRFG
jgi:hypothetical protein